MSNFLVLAASIVSAGQSFECTPIAVWDGDGPIWCAEGPHIRLAGISAREIDGTCMLGHPCPDSSAKAAKAALINLVGWSVGIGQKGHTLVKGPTMRCLSTGGASGTRTGAWCVSPRGGDLSCSMLAGGWAAKWDRYWKGHVCK